MEPNLSSQVLVVNDSVSQKDEVDVLNLLQRLGHAVTSVESLADGIRKIGETGFNLAVVNQTNLNEQSVPPLIKLNLNLSTLPLLVISKQISIFAYRKIGLLNNFVTLQKPFDENLLSKLIDKIVAEKPIKPSILPRFVTDEPVRIWVLGSGLHIASRMKNYSAGGAFMQYRGISMKIGDRIHVGFPKYSQAPSSPEQASLRAQVRWIKEGDGPQSPMRGIGIQFDP